MATCTPRASASRVAGFDCSIACSSRRAFAAPMLPPRWHSWRWTSSIYGRADLAWSFVDSYVRASGDSALLALLDFYACYRAYVRGKVRSLRLAQGECTRGRERASSPSREPISTSRGRTLEGSRSRPWWCRWACPRVARPHWRGRSPVDWAWCTSRQTSSAKLSRGCAQPNGARTISPGSVRPGHDPAHLCRAASTRCTWLRRGRVVVLDATYGSPTSVHGTAPCAATRG